MFVDIDRNVIEASTDDSATFTITVSNTGEVIDKYQVEALGLDHHRYVRVEPADGLALFPGESGDVEVTVTVPSDRPAAGTSITAERSNRLGLEIRSTADESDIEVVELDLQVRPNPGGIRVNVTPDLVTIGRRGEFSIRITNDGNDDQTLHLRAVEAEDHLTVTVWPKDVVVPVGESVHAFMTAQGRRKLLGAPTAREVTLLTTDERTPDEPIETVVTILQRAWIPRGALLVAGLALLFGVWAVLISVGLDRIAASVDDRIDGVEVNLEGVEDAAADAAAADAAAAAAAAGAGVAGGTDPTAGSAEGRVLADSTGDPVAGAKVTAILVDLTLDPGDDSPEPGSEVGEATSDDSGAFALQDLPGGSYRLQVEADGYLPLPLTEIVVKATKPEEVILRLVGRPGAVSGSVLEPLSDGSTVVSAGASVRVFGAAAERTGEPVVSATTDAEGVFALDDVPTAGVYELLFDKGEGATYLQAVKRVTLAPGEQLVLDPVVLSTGTATVSGSILGAQPVGAPTLLGGATVDLLTSGGDIIYRTRTQTDAAVLGRFELLSIPTPATYTVRASAPGYATASRVIGVAVGESPPAFSMTLLPAVGSITGKVSGKTAAGGTTPLGGVAVNVTGTLAEGVDPSFTLATTSLSIVADTTDPSEGLFRLDGLPVPGTYVLTFSLDGYKTVAIEASLTPAAPTVDRAVTLELSTTPAAATGSVAGTVIDLFGAGVADVRLTVTNTAVPTDTRVVSTVTEANGRFEVAGLAPGSYTVDAGTDPAYSVAVTSFGVTADVETAVSLTAASRDVSSVSTSSYAKLSVLSTGGATIVDKTPFVTVGSTEIATVNGIAHGTLVIFVGFNTLDVEVERRLFVLAPALTFSETS